MKTSIRALLFLTVWTASTEAADYPRLEFEPEKDRSGFEKVEVSFNVDLTFTYQALSHDFTPSDGTARQPIQ